MGKTPYFDLSDFFRPRRFDAKTPDLFLRKRLEVYFSLKKNEEKILKSSHRIKSGSARRTPDFYHITILLASKPPSGIGLVLRTYKMDPHEIWF